MAVRYEADELQRMYTGGRGLKEVARLRVSCAWLSNARAPASCTEQQAKEKAARLQ